MKIIKKSNFDDETVSDRLIADNVSPYWASLLVRLLNERCGLQSEDFFKAVEDDHKLYTYEP